MYRSKGRRVMQEPDAAIGDRRRDSADRLGAARDKSLPGFAAPPTAKSSTKALEILLTRIDSSFNMIIGVLQHGKFTVDT